MRNHDWIDRRSLALHAAVASRLEADASLIELARHNVERWSRMHPSSAVAEWKRLLDESPVSEIVRLLRSTDENANRLRQSSPFAGILSERERRQILKAHDPRRS